MLDYLQQYNKAIVALLAPVLVALGGRWGLALSDDQALTLATLITGFLVYLVPNKPRPIDWDKVNSEADKLKELMNPPTEAQK